MKPMKTKHIIAAAVVLLFPIVAGAQVLKGSYFLDNSINRHKMNPAFAPRANYFQLPAIGNLGFGVYSNLSVPTFMYPVDGKLGTFLHPSVSVEQFRKDMPKHPHLDADVDVNLLSFGWFTKKKAFSNFTLDTRVMLDDCRSAGFIGIFPRVYQGFESRSQGAGDSASGVCGCQS